MPCPICGFESLQGISLSDGNILHESCYNNIISKSSTLSYQLDRIRVTKKNLELKLYKSTSIVENIFRFLFGGDTPEAIREELKSTNKLLEDTYNHYIQINNIITSIYDLWTTYPPDWRTRVATIKDRQLRYCSQCGSCRNLHVHHKIPLSRGGNNKLDNLILLCETCHKKIHNTDTFSGNNRSPSFGEMITKITYAISSRRNIEFLYKKPTDTKYSKRTVTPSRLKQVQHLKTNGSTLCIEGFCHTRKETRTFALKRMKNLIIV